MQNAVRPSEKNKRFIANLPDFCQGISTTPYRLASMPGPVIVIGANGDFQLCEILGI